MFQLYDSTRRHICIASFLAFGLLPTALVAIWCVSRHLPSHLQAETRRLARQLGLDVRVHDFKHLCPGVVLYEGIELADPETGCLLLRCRQLEVRSQQNSDQSNPRPVLVLRAVQPEINAAGLQCLWQTLQRTAEGHHGRLDADLQLTADALVVLPNAGVESQTLYEVEATLATLADGVKADAAFHLNDGDATPPLHICAVRKRTKDSPPVNGLSIQTGENKLSCNLLALALGKTNPLGSESRFSGYFGAYDNPDGWQGELSGQFSNVDLDRLVTEHFAPHRLSGAGDLVIQSAKFHAGRLDEATGTLSAGPGIVDRSLLQAAVERWGLTPPTEAVHVPEMVDYQQLVFSLTLNGEGVQIQGLCSIGGPGTILAIQNKRLLGEPTTQPRPLAALVQTLVPPSEWQVPVNPQTDWLMRYLPISQIAATNQHTKN